MFESLVQRAPSDPRIQLGQGALAEEIAELQELLGTSLPADYLEFLQRWGWASLGNTDVFGLGTKDRHTNAMVATEQHRKWVWDDSLWPDPEEVEWYDSDLVIGDRGNGDVYFLRTGTPYRGKVPAMCWDHELIERTITAMSFEEWIEAILNDRDFIPPGPLH